MGGACAPGRVGSDVVGRGGCADSTDAAFDADPADVGATVVSPPALQVEGLPVEGLPVEALPAKALPAEEWRGARVRARAGARIREAGPLDILTTDRWLMGASTDA